MVTVWDKKFNWDFCWTSLKLGLHTGVNTGSIGILNLLLALFLGTLLGVGVGFLVELLDRRVRSGQDIAGLDIPVLGEVAGRSRLAALLRRLFRRNRMAQA